MSNTGKMVGALSRVLEVAGTPTDGTSGTFAGEARIGQLLSDTTNGRVYINQGTQASPAWQPVGAAGGAVELVANKTGGTLTANTLVSLDGGYDTTLGRPTVVKADADAGGKLPDFVVTADIANNAAGVVSKTFTTAANLNTNTGSVGDPVYLDVTAGAYTETMPSGADDTVHIVGTKVVKSATVGQIRFDLNHYPKWGGNDVLNGGSGKLIAVGTPVTHIVDPTAPAAKTMVGTTAAAAATTASAVPTDAAALTSYGYTEAQANAIVAAVNALIVDRDNIRTTLEAIRVDINKGEDDIAALYTSLATHTSREAAIIDALEAFKIDPGA